MSMFPINGGKTEINPQQIVMAAKQKGGDEWRLYMTDDKEIVVTKHEYAEIRERVSSVNLRVTFDT